MTVNGELVIWLIMASFLLAGLLIARWWVFLLTVPFGIWVAYVPFQDVIENDSPPYWSIGIIFAFLAGGAIGLGLLIRQAVRELRR